MEMEPEADTMVFYLVQIKTSSNQGSHTYVWISWLLHSI